MSASKGTVYCVKDLVKMGYIFLLIATLSGSIKAYSAKRISADVTTVSDNIHVTLGRMLICTVISALGILLAAGGRAFLPGMTELVICTVSGLSMVSFVMCWLFAVKKGAFLLVNAFTAASFIIPGILGLLLKERFTSYKLTAVACICVALFFLLRYNTRIKGKITRTQMTLLMLVWLSQGMNQSTQKLYVQYAPDKSVLVYNFYTFLLATVFLLLFQLFMKRKSAKHGEMKPYVYGYIVVMAVALFMNSYFLALAAARVDAILLYPLFNALGLVVNSIMAHVCFGEHMKRDSVIGIIFTLAALILSQL